MKKNVSQNISERMRITLLLFLITLLGCSGMQTEQGIFYEELGSKKASSFKLLIDSYEQFLEYNYPDK
jgi:hypothetical protein